MSQDDGPSTNDGSDPGAEAVGTVAEEAARLFGALSDWARGVDGHLATGAAECTYCPVCRTVHVLRQASPEVRAQLTTAATALLQAASGLLATGVPHHADRSGVEHIDLDDVGDWPDDTDPEESN
jgi:hypothetical protein